MEPATSLVPVPALGIELEILAVDTEIGPAIARGSWEEHETRLFRAHLTAGARVLDLGANVGWFSVLAILAGAEVDAFEPVPEIASVLERNVARAMQRGPGRARVHRFAAGAERGKARIALAATNRGDNRVLDAGAPPPPDMQGAREIEIEIERVDALVEGPIDLWKVDTQGSEWLALQGARETLAASRRMALLLEFWPYALRGARPEQLLAFLFEQGFRIGKATAGPYPMSAERILRQAAARGGVRGGFDLYAVRGRPFHVLGPKARLRSLWRGFKED